MTSLGIVVIILGLLVLSFYKPIFGVTAYLVIYFTFNPEVWWSVYLQKVLPRPSLVAVIVLLASCLLHANKLDWHVTRREIELYLFLVIIWLVSMFSGVGIEPENWYYLEKMTKLFVFIFLFIRIVGSVESYRQVYWSMVLCGVFLAYQAHMVSYGHFYSGRLDTMGGIDFHEANGFAAFLSVAVIFLGVELLHVSWARRLVYVVGIVLMLNAIILTQSRAIFLGLLIATPYVLLRPPVKYRKKVLGFVLLGALVCFMLVDRNFIERMDTVREGVEKKDAEVFSRIGLWKASIPMFLDHPMGVGIRNFERLAPYYGLGRNIDAHNTYVLCYSELGISGIVLFLIILGESLLQVRRVRVSVRNLKFEDEVSLRGFAMGAVFTVYLAGYMMTHSIVYMEILWILLSLPICLENSTRKILEKA